MATSVLEETRSKIQARLDKLNEQLAPLQTEHDELMSVMAALNSGIGNTNTPSRGRGRSNGGQRRRAASGENRADEMFKIIADEPGLSGSEIARRLDTQPGYISKLGKQLVEDGRVRRDDKKAYFANNGSTPAAA